MTSPAASLATFRSLTQPHHTVRATPWLAAFVISVTLFPLSPAIAQVASPVQSGHYAPVLMNVRDLAHPPPGLFVLSYNAYVHSGSFIDHDGNKFKGVKLSDIKPALPDVNVDLELDALASVPTVFWASNFQILGGARYMVGIAPTYLRADVSIITERAGIANPDTSFVRKLGDTNSGFSDLMVTPLGLSWGWEKADFTAMYSFYAPTGTYETGDSKSLGLGFWTHQFQGRGYFYPRPDKSTAVMLGVVYELNGSIEDVDVTPGNRLTLEWGLSQYLSERLELSAQGGHNWQVTDDTGADVYWNAGHHDRKSTVAFGAAYWVWKEHLAVTGKYSFDFAARQRFDNDSFYLNVLFAPGWLAGQR